MNTRAEAEAELARFGRRHGWYVSSHSLGYYKLRFMRIDGTVQVRFGAGGRLSEVAVNVAGRLYRLGLPARARLEEILSAPPHRPPPPKDDDE
jgi:hypothetical protein